MPASKTKHSRLLCRHCNLKHPNRPMNLCWVCYYTPGVRGMYLSESKYARRGEGLVEHEGPPQPLESLPGSLEKVLDLERRAQAGQTLFMDGDRQPDLE